MGTIPAGIGTPTANGIPCSAIYVSTATSALYVQRDIIVGNAIWKCTLASDGVTYAWIPPYAPSVQFYTSAGVASPVVKCMVANTASAATTGAFSFTLTPLGITTLLTVQLTSLSTSTTLATGMNQPYVSIANVTTVSGVVSSGTVLAALGATIAPQSVSTTVYGLFCGT